MDDSDGDDEESSDDERDADHVDGGRGDTKDICKCVLAQERAGFSRDMESAVGDTECPSARLHLSRNTRISISSTSSNF